MKTMQTKVIKLDENNPDIEKIKEAAHLIDCGGLVAFPTETVYGIACRIQTNSLLKLDKLKVRMPGKRYTLHIGQKDDIKKYVPAINLRALKLIKNAWPGPLTLIFELNERDLRRQQQRFKQEVFENLYKDNSIGVRCPDNRIAFLLLMLTSNPVVAPSANPSGEIPAVTPEQALKQFSNKIEMLLDAGPCRYKKNSTVAKICPTKVEILRPGVYDQEQLEELSTVKFLFVCTGNTCRSPMAVGIFRKYLANKLKCEVDQLEKIGYKITSAGILDMSGASASREAIAACGAKGIDIKAHKSRAISRQLIQESDYIFAMERMHCESIINLCPEAESKCVLLSGNQDIADPIGQGQEFFNDCLELIEKSVKKRIDELVI